MPKRGKRALATKKDGDRLLSTPAARKLYESSEMTSCVQDIASGKARGITAHSKVKKVFRDVNMPCVGPAC